MPATMNGDWHGVPGPGSEDYSARSRPASCSAVFGLSQFSLQHRNPPGTNLALVAEVSREIDLAKPQDRAAYRDLGEGVALPVDPWIRYGSSLGGHMDVCVLSREAAELYQPGELEICISISDPQAPPAQLSPNFLAVLRLEFSDIVAAEQPADVLFAEDHAAAIVQFVEQWSQAERLVVHCHVGASRSPGVALGLCDRLGWETAELERGYPAWNRWVRQVLAGEKATMMTPADADGSTHDPSPES